MIYQTKDVKLKPRIVLHGAEGVGKTSFASNFPNPVFIQTEDGLRGLEKNVAAHPVATTFEEFMTYMKDPENQKHDTLVIDTGDWMEKLLAKYLIRTHGGGNKDATLVNILGGYGAGYEKLQSEWLNILHILDWYNKAHNMSIIMICHTALVSQKNSMLGEYDRAVLSLYQSKSNPNVGIRSSTVEWCDIVGYAYQPATASRAGNSAIASAGLGGGNKLAVEPHPAYQAKNKYGLKNCDLNYQSFSNQLEI